MSRYVKLNIETILGIHLGVLTTDKEKLDESINSLLPEGTKANPLFDRTIAGFYLMEKLPDCERLMYNDIEKLYALTEDMENRTAANVIKVSVEWLMDNGYKRQYKVKRMSRRFYVEHLYRMIQEGVSNG